MEQDTVTDKDSKLFDQYLIAYQEDIKRIVGKYRKSYHILSNQEICSECNMYLVKKKYEILKSFNEENVFTQSQFNKIAFHYAKNSVIWTQGILSRKGYHAKRVDLVTNTDEGPKTSFEIEVENHGIENKDIDSDALFFSQNIKNFMHLLTEYSYLLTDKESRILALLKSGLNQDQIAERLKVTHQAISLRVIELQEKIKNHFNLNEVTEGGSAKAITKGLRSIETFFDVKNKATKVIEEDKLLLRDYVLANPYKYNVAQLNNNLFNNKYTSHKVAGAIKSLKLTPFIISSSRPVAAPVKKEILNCFKKGNSIKKVSKLLDLPINTVRRMRAQFVIEKKLKKLYKK